MKPLVSGEHAKRYVEPFTNNYILFPYMINDEGEAYLIPQTRMEDDYPMKLGHTSVILRKIYGLGKIENLMTKSGIDSVDIKILINKIL